MQTINISITSTPSVGLPKSITPIPPVTPSKQIASGNTRTESKTDVPKLPGLPANVEMSIMQDDETKQIIVKLTNPDTGEVVKQIPMEEYVKLAKAIDKMISNFVDIAV